MLSQSELRRRISSDDEGRKKDFDSRPLSGSSPDWLTAGRGPRCRSSGRSHHRRTLCRRSSRRVHRSGGTSSHLSCHSVSRGWTRRFRQLVFRSPVGAPGEWIRRSRFVRGRINGSGRIRTTPRRARLAVRVSSPSNPDCPHRRRWLLTSVRRSHPRKWVRADSNRRKTHSVRLPGSESGDHPLHTSVRRRMGPGGFEPPTSAL